MTGPFLPLLVLPAAPGLERMMAQGPKSLAGPCEKVLVQHFLLSGQLSRAEKCQLLEL